MRDLEPTTEKFIKRGSDCFGKYWQVYYEWEINGDKYAFGSPRIYEDLLPEFEHEKGVSEVVRMYVDLMVKDD